MGQVVGYTPADYLVQHASRQRRTDPTGDGTAGQFAPRAFHAILS
jgi:hypothetical protein